MLLPLPTRLRFSSSHPSCLSPGRWGGTSLAAPGLASPRIRNRLPAAADKRGSAGDGHASTGLPSELYCPSATASAVAKDPTQWQRMMDAMKVAGQEFLLGASAANAALWAPPCLKFWDAMCHTAPVPQDFTTQVDTLALSLQDILAKVYTEEDKMQIAVFEALEASGAFPGVVKAKRGEQEPDLRIKDQALVEVKLAGGQGIAHRQNMVYYVCTIADKDLLPVLEHCCAPLLCIAIRSEVRFSCCARFGGHPVSQELCTWTTDQPLERLVCMLHAARAFCMEAKTVWEAARQAAAIPAQGGAAPMRRKAQRSWQDVSRSEAPLHGVLPTWLHCYDTAQQIGGRRRNVWLLQCSERQPAASFSSSSSSSASNRSNSPSMLVVKFLEVEGATLELALRSWAVHHAWGQAGHAPAVVGRPWLCAGGRYLGYAMKYLPLQQRPPLEQGMQGEWRLVQDWLSSSSAAQKVPPEVQLQLTQAALVALAAAHQVQVDWSACTYDALPPSAVCGRMSVPPKWTAVHGDLRPCNVAASIGPAGIRVCFLDFGFAGVAPGLSGDEHAARFPLTLNRARGMWAYGVEARAIITRHTDTLQLTAALAGFGL